MNFSLEAINFLMENRMRNDKEWFSAHKEDYRRLVAEPFSGLISAIAPYIGEIDEKIICNPKRIARVYRDTRFTKDKSLFRENIWAVFLRRDVGFGVPAFYADISPNGFEYGCGFYSMEKDALSEMRNLVLSNDRSFRAADKEIRSGIFTLGGELYKRSRYPSESEGRRFWLDRKNLFAYTTLTDEGLIFGDISRLGERVGEDFLALRGFYRFLFKAAEAAGTEKTDCSSQKR